MINKSKTLLPLCITLVPVLITVAIIITGLIINFNTEPKLKLQPPCKSKTCTETAVEISKRINTTADPCDNFYDFVCGGSYDDLKIDTDQVDSGIIQNHQHFLDKALHTLLKQPDDPNELNVFKSTKSFYRDCIDLSLLEDMGEPSLLSVFSEMGGFPVLTVDWDEEKFSWENLTIKFKQQGIWIHNLFTFGFLKHPFNSSIEQLIVSNTIISNY